MCYKELLVSRNWKYNTKYQTTFDAWTNSKYANIQSALRVQPTDLIALIARTKIGKDLHWNQYKIWLIFAASTAGKRHQKRP